MKTLNEHELGAIDGGALLPSDLPLPGSSPFLPSPREPMAGIVGEWSVTPSYLNG